MAAGVNFNNVWAALGEPVSVFRYHPNEDHHIGGSDASGIVWKVGEGVTRWKPGDEVVMHCNQASYEDPEVHGLDPLAAPSQQIWGYETSWGSFAQFCKVQAQQLLHKPKHLAWEEAASYGLTYFTAYRMLIDRCKLQSGHRVLIWGAAGGLGVFATQLCALAGADAVGVVSSEEKGKLIEQLGAVGYINRSEFAGMMRRGGETPTRRRRASRSRGASARRSSGSSAARRTSSSSTSARRRSRPRCSCVKPVRQGRDLRRHLGLPARLRRPLPVDAPEGDHRLALRQRVGGDKANELIEESKIRPGAVADDGLRGGRRGPPAAARQQAPRQDRDPRRRDRGGPGQDRRRSGRDPRGGGSLHGRLIVRPLVRDGVPRQNEFAADVAAESRRSRCATARPSTWCTAPTTIGTRSPR